MGKAAFLVATAAALAAAPALGAPPVDVTAPAPSGSLAGTLLEASPDSPLILIIPGSGPTDRDGNSPLGVRAAPYRLLAEALAAKGVSSVRIDKRGMFGSASAGNPNNVKVADYATDIRSWVRTLREGRGRDCIWLLGHSEGALMALAAAADRPEGVCGLLLVSGPGRRLSDVIREQLRASPQLASGLDGALDAIARLEAGQRVDPAGLAPALQPLFAPQVQSFLIDMFDHDPADLAREVSLPILVVHGLSDIQTSEADARRLAGANRNARLVLLPGVNHVLKQVGNVDRSANMATYADPDRPIAPEVVDAIAEFVTR